MKHKTYDVKVLDGSDTIVTFESSGERTPDIGERIFLWVKGTFVIGEVIAHHD